MNNRIQINNMIQINLLLNVFNIITKYVVGYWLRVLIKIIL